MAILKIPIRNDIPAYTLSIGLEGTTFVLSFRYTERTSRWMMDILDVSEVPIVEGVVLLVNLNLTSRFKDSRMPKGYFLLADESGNNAQPNRLNFSNDVNLFYVESTT